MQYEITTPLPDVLANHKISIIIPVYNAAASLHRCIDSILAQTIGLNTLELILINDASTDQSLDILLAYEKAYPDQIMVINCEENGQQGTARNIGMQYASGEYLTFVDADDCIHERMLEILYAGITTYHTDISECDWVSFSDKIPENSCFDKQAKQTLLLVESDEDQNAIFRQNALLVSLWRKLYRTSFLKEIQARFPEKCYMEDIFFTQLVMAYCKSIFHIHCPMYFYYENPNSTMHSQKLKTYYMDVFYVSSLLIQELIRSQKFFSLQNSLEWAFLKRIIDLYSYMKQISPFPTENWEHIADFTKQVFPRLMDNKSVSSSEQTFASKNLLAGEVKAPIMVDILIAVAERGGVENVLNQLGIFLESRGFHIRIIQLVYEGTPWANEQFEFHHIYDSRKNMDLEKLYQGYASFLTSHGIPDVILATAWPYMSYIGKRAMMELNKTAPVISYLHARPAQYERAGFGGVDVLDFADYHFAISPQIASDITAAHPNAQIIRVENPLMMATHPPKGENNLFHLVYVGRLSPEKHVEQMIEAISRTPYPYHLSIVGDGDQKQALQNLTKQLKVSDRIHFLGWQDDPWSAVPDAYALLLASEYEGYSLVAIEALAMGKAVITTPVLGVIDRICPGQNGYIFPVNDIDGLCQILSLMANQTLPQISSTTCRESVQTFIGTQIQEHIANQLYQIAPKNSLIDFKNNKVSIIIPCYNVEAYLSECIESILNQTFSLDRLEIICVNDASTDKTLSILLDYDKQYPDYFLVINCEENHGPGYARNLAMTYATGDFYVFIDADDRVLPEYIQQLYQLITKFDCDFAQTGHVCFADTGASTTYPGENRYYNLTDISVRKEYILRHGANNSAWAKIYKKDFLMQHHITFAENLYFEDVFFFELCMMYAKNMVFSPDILYQYRINEHGIIRGKGHEKKRIDGWIVQKMFCDEMVKANLFSPYQDELALMYYLKSVIDLVAKPDWEQMDEELRHTLKSVKEDILVRFPTFFSNPYILSDTSEYNMSRLHFLEHL